MLEVDLINPFSQGRNDRIKSTKSMRVVNTSLVRQRYNSIVDDKPSQANQPDLEISVKRGKFT